VHFIKHVNFFGFGLEKPGQNCFSALQSGMNNGLVHVSEGMRVPLCWSNCDSAQREISY